MFMPTSRQLMKERVDTLLALIEKNPGINLLRLRNKFAVVHGVRPQVVTEYLKMLERGGFIVERENKVYPVKAV